MKTVFDWLCDPAIRMHPALLIGKADLRTLQTWMAGYMGACMDAGITGPVTTSNGVHLQFFRDYVAVLEEDRSTQGMADIIEKAAVRRGCGPWDLF